MSVASAFDQAKAIGAGDNGHGGEADEKPVLDDARDRRQAFGERRGLRDAFERGVDDQMAAIGDESMSILVTPHLRPAGTAGLGAGPFERAPGGGEPEGHDLDRQREAAELPDPQPPRSPGTAPGHWAIRLPRE